MSAASAGVSPQRIGFTIVGGFLGSGKTSLITGMLGTATERMAFVVNDLGDLNLDAAILRQAKLRGGTDAPGGSGDIIELTNGCVCCTIGDSLATTLRDLCLRDPAPERIVIECSGAADPGLVAKYGSRTHLEEPTVLVVVDATDIRQRAEDPRFASLVAAQLQSADLVAVSKTDLIGPDVAVDVLGWLAQRVSVPVLVGAPDDLGAVAPSAHQRSEIDSSGTAAVVHAETMTMPGTVTEAELTDLLASTPNLIRAKGLVVMASGPTLVQVSPTGLDLSPWPSPVPDPFITLLTPNLPH